MSNFETFLEAFIRKAKTPYKEGEFGYWWTVIQGKPDISGLEYGEGSIDCVKQNLTSLKGSPKSVSGNFYCGFNKLPTLEFCPEKVKGNFICDLNRLTTLEFAPKEVKGNFSCRENTKKFTEEDVKAVSNVKGQIYV